QTLVIGPKFDHSRPNTARTDGDKNDGRRTSKAVARMQRLRISFLVISRCSRGESLFFGKVDINEKYRLTPIKQSFLAKS
ncbi:MAG: hypothetical protein ABIZ64_03645, partial [Casimicrobium sp.]